MNADLPLSATERTTLHRLRERGRTDRADLYAVLDAGLICHLGVIPHHIKALAGHPRYA
jgi:uncharacterized protein